MTCKYHRQYDADPFLAYFRADYCYPIVNANATAPAFFAQAKSRGGHRVSFGIFHTW